MKYEDIKDRAGVTNDEWRAYVKSEVLEIQKIEDRLSEMAVKHNNYVYIGDYGYGRSINLEEDSEFEVGSWVSSSQYC